LTTDSGVAHPVPAVDGTASSDSDKNRPALMMALDHGAMEANFQTGVNSDVILTPDFRILISAPGLSAVRLRLGAQGDTCVDNHGPNAPYVTVSSVFEGGAYRVMPDQRVMFQHGSLNEVVDNETEACGCPVETPKPPTENEFPVAQSAGLAPPPKVQGNVGAPGTAHAQMSATLKHNAAPPEVANTTPQAPPAPPPHAKTKSGFFGRLGHFFKNLFGG
jgi:hypothetical protein